MSAGSISSSGLYTAPSSITAQQTVTVTATSQADNTKTGTATITLLPPQTPVITWAAPAAITYGTPLSAAQLDATANVPGTFVYSPAAGTVLAAGNQTLSVMFTPTNTAEYTTATAGVMLTVNKATPVITWTAPAAITYGTTLSATQLDATANVAGTFTYSPAAGSVLNAGTQTLTATFTPTNTTDYTTATASVPLTVNQATPTISISNLPASGTYGGSFAAVIAYSGNGSPAETIASSTPSVCTVSDLLVNYVGAGVCSLTASATATTDYSAVTGSAQTFSVGKATLTITADNASRGYGASNPVFAYTPTGFVNGDTSSVLSGSPSLTTLATASSPVGSYPITAAIGTLAAANYNFAFANGTLTVTPVGLTIMASSMTVTYGAAVPAITPSYAGFVNGDTAASLNPAPVCSTTYTTASTPGAYPATCSGAVDANYAISYVGGAVTVNQATPAIAWAASAAITYGTALSATQLNATASVPGTFTYSPAAGTVPTAGNQTLSVTFTPTDTIDYTSAAASVPLTVNQATPVITWATPAAITSGTALSATQLDATANVPGTFVYSPAAGVLPAPGSQTLSVTFTPTDATDYTVAMASVVLTVNPAQCNTSGYTYARAITIDHTKVPNTDQTNFPFLFSTTDPLLATTANGGHVANSNGYDIIFTSDPAGQNPLPYEMEQYNPATGQVVAWVQIPDLSHTSDTVIYLFYGNANITTSQQNPTAVWDSNYKGVWHLGSSSVLSLNDSTANANNATDNGALVASGPFAGGMLTNGSTYATIGTPSSLADLAQGPATFSVWVNSAAGSGGRLMGKDDANNDEGWALSLNGNHNVDFVVVYSGGDFRLPSTGATGNNTWSYVTVTLNGNANQSGSATIYINGVPNTTGSGGSGSTVDDSAQTAYLDNSTYGDQASAPFNGTTAEFRISNTIRSADWIATEFANQSSPATFYSLSTENQSISPSAVTLYDAQSQQFTVTALASCPASVTWSMSPSVGTLTPNGSSGALYTAPASIPVQQMITITATNPVSNDTLSAVVTLMPPAVNPTLSLAAASPSPYVTGSAETFVATLKNQDGTALSGVVVSFSITGVNAGTGNGITDSNGNASFTYTGNNSGTDTVQATATVGSTQVNSEAVTAIWLVPSQPVSTSTVYGVFFPTDNQCAFDAVEAKIPAFNETFPTINFNPPAGTIPENTSSVNVNSRPFTDVTTDLNGNYTGTIVAEGNGYQAGVGSMNYFEAVFTGELTVASAGNTVFNFYDDDGFIFGIGNGATRVSGSSINMPVTSVFNGYPSMGADNGPQSPIGNQVVVNFPAPGTYPYEVDYTECDGGQLALTMAQGASSSTGIPPTGSLTVSPNSINPLPFGGSQAFTIFAGDAAGNPVPNVHVGLVVTGVDNLQLSGITDSSGNATIVYNDVNPGTAYVQAVAFVSGTVDYSNMVTVPWTLPAGSSTGSGGSGTLAISISAQSPVVLPNTLQLNGSATDSALPSGTSPSVTWSEVSGPGSVAFTNATQASTTATFSAAGTYVLELSATDSLNSGSAQISIVVDPTGQTAQGWIGGPANGSAVSGIVPITVAAGQTLTSGTLSYYPANNPTNVTVLNSAVSASGGQQIGTLDTTALPNGSYWITLEATNSSGTSQYSLALVTVTGNFKPGRVTTTVTDLVVPATGLPIQIQRTYDSLNAGTIGDFGYGWNLGINVNLVVDNKGDVTFTLGGQRKTFYLTPQIFGCSPLIGCLFPWYSPVFTPEPGLFGTLTDSGSGCVLDMLLADGECVGGGQYNPPGYIYTDPNGTSYTISASGQLQSITDRSGNGLTIGPNGITSTTGLNVPFVRDAQNRITQITDPAGNVYSYGYDANGNLASVTYPPTSGSQTCSGANAPNTSQYSYYPDADHPDYPAHYYAGGTDGRCNPLPSTSFYPAGQMDTSGNYSVAGKLQSVTDAAGKTTTYTYNLATNTTTVTYPTDPADGNGQPATATMVYDANGDVLSSTDPLGHTTTNTYSANFNLLSTTDPLGHTTSYTYDASGNKTSTTYPNPNATTVTEPAVTNTTSTITYGLNGAPLTVTDENGNARNFGYDANMNPLRETDMVNGQTATIMTSVYNASGQLQALAVGADLTTNPAAASTFTYDANGNIASATDPLGRTTSFTYNALGQRLTMTRSAGANSTPESGSASPLLQQAAVSPTQGIRSKTMVVTRKPGAQLNALAHSQDSLSPLGGNTCNPPTPPIYSVTDFYSAMYGIKSEIDSLGRTSSETYDANGNVATYTDANGNVYSYSYDALNRLTQVNLPTNPVTSYTFTYDYANHVIDTTDPEGHDRHNVYDLAGRLTSVTLGYGTSSATTTTFAYNDDGTLQSATDNAGHTTNYTYDPAGNLTQVARGPVSVQYAYDNDRNRISATDGNGNTTSFQYDANQRLQQIGFADHTNQSIAYDSSGNVTGVTDQAGHTITYQYDNANRMIGVTQANAPATSNDNFNYCRDGLGNLSSWTDENGHVLSQTADAIGRPTSITYPDGTSGLVSTYDLNSNLLSLGKFNTSGTTTAQFAYDSLNRLISQTPDSSYGEVPAQFTYTANGLLSKMTDSTGTTSYTYDSLDRLITKSTPAGTLNYTYDAVGNVAGMTSTGANAVSVSYTYDELNRLSTVVDNNLPAGQNTTTYTYDPASNLATATYPNGLQSTYSYDQLNRLSSASTAVSSYQYSRDNNGNILTATEGSGRSATYTYDGIDELTSETVANDPAKDNGAISYVLDPVGNRDSDTSSLAPIDSSSTGFNADDQPQTESYDANGDTIATGGNTFAYNSWLKLVSMNGGQVTLAYNGLGQLVSKSTSSGTTQYLIDDLSPTGYPQVVEELQGGQVTRTYTYGLERISQLQPVNTNGNNTWTPSFYVYDGRGTVRMLANAAGAVTDTYAYDAFGNLLNQTGSTPNAYLYRGERWDQDLGLYYLRARWYNPATGRFMSRDPYAGSIWDPASLHRYNYARANPVNYIDPSGRGRPDRIRASPL